VLTTGGGTVAQFGADGVFTGVENITFNIDSTVFNLNDQTEAFTITTANGTNTVTLRDGVTGHSFTGGTGVDTVVTNRAGLVGMTTMVGGTGNDVIQMSAASTALVDADFASLSSVEALTTTGVSQVVLGTSATAAGLTTVNQGNNTLTVTSTQTATAVAASGTANKTLTLAGSANFTVTAVESDVTGTTSTGTLALTTTDLADNAITVAAGTGNVTVAGGAANDAVTISGMATDGQTLVFSAASTMVLTAGAGAQTITGGAAASTITGGAGDDIINVGTAGAANTLLFGDSNGKDTISTFTINEDLLTFTAITGIDGVKGNAVALAANAATNDLATGKIAVHADGSDMTGALGFSAPAQYLDTTVIAANLAGSLTEANGEKYIVIVNDLVGDDVYIYSVGVESAIAGSAIAAANIGIIGVLEDIGSTAVDVNELTA
jgi:hypothetical protein